MGAGGDAEGITQAMVVPTMLGRVLGHLSSTGHDLDSLRHLSYGGGRMPLELIRQAMDLLPNVAFVNAYGLTETSSTIAVLGPEEHREAAASDDPAVRARLGSVGRPLPTIEVEIRDSDGNVLPPGERGEIYVRGEQVAGEYLGRSVLTDDGWFPTNDAGYLDDDGYLFLDGRLDDVIVRGAENLSPGEIEDVLLAHPAVAEAAVVGVPDPEWGEAVAAAVVSRTAPTSTEDELQAWVRERLRSTKTPELIEFRAELPYNETGKLLRRVLRDELHAGSELTAVETFVAGDGTDVGYRRWLPDGHPGHRGVAHGVSEHGGRYERFAGSSIERGLGGLRPRPSWARSHRRRDRAGQRDRPAWSASSTICWQLNMARRVGDLPVVLFGHSMGRCWPRPSPNGRVRCSPGSALSGSGGVAAGCRRWRPACGRWTTRWAMTRCRCCPCSTRLRARSHRVRLAQPGRGRGRRLPGRSRLRTTGHVRLYRRPDGRRRRDHEPRGHRHPARGAADPVAHRRAGPGIRQARTCASWSANSATGASTSRPATTGAPATRS